MTFIDPVMQNQPEGRDRVPFVFPEEFYVKYREQEDGSQKPEEWVLVTKKGMQNPQRTPMRWRDIERSPDLLAVLKPFYDNWKKGQDAPISGTPLDAWMADPALVKVLNQVNVRSVEDFAGMPDHTLVRLNIPGVRDRQNRAKAFLEAQGNTAKVSAEVTTLRSDNESLRNEVKELKALIEAHVTKKAEEEIKKRGPGRPRKSPIESAA